MEAHILKMSLDTFSNKTEDKTRAFFMEKIEISNCVGSYSTDIDLEYTFDH